MSCKLFLVLSAVICIVASLEGASLRGILGGTNAVVPKLDYESVEANVRSARQSYAENDSGEDSDEDDEEDDAELQHVAAIRRQQAYEQAVDNSQEGSDEDNEDNFEEDDDDNYVGRRLKRAALQPESNNEIKETSAIPEVTENQNKEPALEASSTTGSSTTSSTTDASNTSVLILIRDAIKKVTELSNTQQVATSAQQYFQMFEHFLQQTIEQVIDDDEDEEDENESTTIVADSEKEPVTEISEPSEKQPLNVTTDKESSNKLGSAQPEQKPQDVEQMKKA